MFKWPVRATVLAILLLGGTAARADILYFTDTTIGTDSMALALNQWATTHPGVSVYTTSSDTTFATQLATGKYNLAVFFMQGYGPSSYPTGVSALQSYVASGGKAIVTDFATFEGSGFVSSFGATFSARPTRVSSRSSTLRVCLPRSILPPIPAGAFSPPTSLPRPESGRLTSLRATPQVPPSSSGTTATRSSTAS